MGIFDIIVAAVQPQELVALARHSFLYDGGKELSCRW